MANKIPQNVGEMPHIGSIVKEHIAKTKLTHSQLGRLMHISPISFSRYCEQKSLQAYLMWSLGNVLEVNLFDIVAKAHPIAPPTVVNTNELAMQQRIADLEKELAIYKEIVLRKMG